VRATSTRCECRLCRERTYDDEGRKAATKERRLARCVTIRVHCSLQSYRRVRIRVVFHGVQRRARWGVGIGKTGHVQGLRRLHVLFVHPVLQKTRLSEEMKPTSAPTYGEDASFPLQCSAGACRKTRRHPARVWVVPLTATTRICRNLGWVQVPVPRRIGGRHDQRKRWKELLVGAHRVRRAVADTGAGKGR
jgi:hypothetical protein